MCERGDSNCRSLEWEGNEQGLITRKLGDLEKALHFLLSMKGTRHGRAEQGGNMIRAKKDTLASVRGAPTGELAPRTPIGRLLQLMQLAWMRGVVMGKVARGRIQNLE